MAEKNSISYGALTFGWLYSLPLSIYGLIRDRTGDKDVKNTNVIKALVNEQSDAWVKTAVAIDQARSGVTAPLTAYTKKAVVGVIMLAIIGGVIFFAIKTIGTRLGNSGGEA